MSSSSATSLMVRKASGALSTADYSPAGDFRATALMTTDADAKLVFVFLDAFGIRDAVDALLQDGGRLEHHDPARRDRDFLAGLGIAADPLALLAHDEGAKGGKLYRLTPFQAVGNFAQDQFDERRRFRAGEAHLLVDRLAQVRSRNGFSRHRQPQSRRPYPAEFTTILAWTGAVNGPGATP